MRVEREHVFVTSEGSPYGRFRKALDRGNLLQAKSAAAELGELPLSDTLELLLLIAKQEREKYQWGCCSLARPLLPGTARGGG